MAGLPFTDLPQQLDTLSRLTSFAAYIHEGLLSHEYNRQISTLRSTSRNHPSAMTNSSVAGDYIRAEKEAGRLVDPVGKPSVPFVHTSPIGLVPKSHQVDRWHNDSGSVILPKIFSAVADMIAWALHCSGIQHQIHYLDDFLFFGAPNTDEGQKALDIVLRVLAWLRVLVASHKTESPATAITYLGILIDTESFELRLPDEKIQHLMTLLNTWSMKRSCTRKDLESLLGHLSHAASIIRPGRTFLRQLFSLLQVAKAPNHFIRLNATAKADLAWWRCFMQSWNGSSFFPLPLPDVNIYSDASGSFGCGAVVEGLGWFQIQWPEAWGGVDIATKELVPVVVAAALWGSRWAGKHICFHTDNMSVMAILSLRQPGLLG